MARSAGSTGYDSWLNWMSASWFLGSVGRKGTLSCPMDFCFLLINQKGVICFISPQPPVKLNHMDRDNRRPTQMLFHLSVSLTSMSFDHLCALSLLVASSIGQSRFMSDVGAFGIAKNSAWKVNCTWDTRPMALDTRLGTLWHYRLRAGVDMLSSHWTRWGCSINQRLNAHF